MLTGFSHPKSLEHLASTGNKDLFGCYEAKIEESEKLAVTGSQTQDTGLQS